MNIFQHVNQTVNRKTGNHSEFSSLLSPLTFLEDFTPMSALLQFTQTSKCGAAWTASAHQQKAEHEATNNIVNGQAK